MEKNALIQQIIDASENFSQVSRDLQEALPGLRNSDRYRKVYDLLSILAAIQEEVVDFRLRKIVTEEHPYLPLININKLKNQQYEKQLSIQQLSERFLQQRRDLIQLLSELPISMWERTGVHEVEGHVTFGELIRRMTVKDREILGQLERLIHPAKK